jgi:competence protein ComEC
LQAIYPQAEFLANLPQQRIGIKACKAPAAWYGDNLDFRVLHPSAGLPYLGNDSSCVISVNGAGFSLLLTGDISKTVERRLVNEGLAQHVILTAPHHGSSTSSSQLLIDTLKPSWALISAGIDNRFDFPRTDVLERYSKAKVLALNTAQCGGLRITARADGEIKIESARVVNETLWRWPADSSCP